MIPYRMNQIRPVAKRRENLYTSSLFPLTIKLQIKNKKSIPLRFFGFAPSTLANARLPGRVKLVKALPPGLTRLANAPQLPGGGVGDWGWKEGLSWNSLMHKSIQVFSNMGCVLYVTYITHYQVSLNGVAISCLDWLQWGFVFEKKSTSFIFGHKRKSFSDIRGNKSKDFWD